MATYVGHIIVEEPGGRRVTVNGYSKFSGNPTDDQVRKDIEESVLKGAPAGSRVVGGSVSRVS